VHVAVVLAAVVEVEEDRAVSIPAVIAVTIEVMVVAVTVRVDVIPAHWKATVRAAERPQVVRKMRLDGSVWTKVH
jgi:hypothetical protein